MERWVCPHCQFAQMLGEDQHDTREIEVRVGNVIEGPHHWHLDARGCANPSCKQLTADVRLVGRKQLGNAAYSYVGSFEKAKARLSPKGFSKPQPSFIPQALREDYDEACVIRDLSPKAAATLVRRCLQGMIRDFCGIKDKRTLNDEIKALKSMVDDGRAPSGVTDESVEAIDQVRGIGNIGAHMEKDIDLIVDVDPNEAQVLIELVEMLFDEWYVARHRRQERLATIKKIAAEKKEAKAPKAESSDAEQPSDA